MAHQRCEPLCGWQAVCEGNREACTEVTPEMVRHFAELAGASHRPRHLRFLRTIMAPGGATIARNQNLVVSALMDASAAVRPKGLELMSFQMCCAESCCSSPCAGS